MVGFELTRGAFTCHATGRNGLLLLMCSTYLASRQKVWWCVTHFACRVLVLPNPCTACCVDGKLSVNCIYGMLFFSKIICAHLSCLCIVVVVAPEFLSRTFISPL